MRVAVLGGLLLLAPVACERAQAQQQAQILPRMQQPVQAAAQVQQPAIRESQSLPSLAPLVDSVKSAVVNVDVQSRMGRGRGEDAEEGGGGDDFFDRFFGGNGNGNGNGGGRRRGGGPVRQGMGSGTIIDGSGLVLTNNHVVEGAVAIRVRLDDGRSFEANVVGRDPATDVAVIRLKGKLDNLPVVKLGDSDAMRPGDWVVAIGNPFGLASSVSVGIISAKARRINAGPYDDFIQTDAAINPGNSGGPLFNMKGEVIGINTAIIGGGSGIGFAVPSNMATALLPQLEKEGTVTRGYLGIGIQSLTPDLAKAMGISASEGAIVLQVNDGSPAKKAGLQSDDVIVALDGQKVISGDGLTRSVALKRPGATSTLTVLRGGRKTDVKVVLGTRPDLNGEGGERERAPGNTDDEGRKQRIGLSFRDVDPAFAQATGMSVQGALISDVAPGSPADRAELSRGMVVVEADRKPVRSAADLMKVLKNGRAGASILLRIQIPGGSGSYTLRALTLP